MTTLLSSNAQKSYQVVGQEAWHGRRDGHGPERFHERVQSLDLSQEISLSHPTKAFAFVGFACDEGVKRNQGREGAVQGPQAFRKALAPLAAPLELTLYDAGDVICQNGDLEQAQVALGEVVACLLRQNITPIIIGGGHELAWGTYLGESIAYPATDNTFLNFDAHLDLRSPLAANKGTSGSSFAQIATHRQTQNLEFHYTCLGLQRTSNTFSLIEKANHLNASLLFADEFHLGGFEAGLELIETLITRHDKISLSLCLDVFASPFAPGVSAPQPLGLFPWHVIPLLRRLAVSNKIVSFGIAELCPLHDQNEVTAKLAANLVADFLSYI